MHTEQESTEVKQVPCDEESEKAYLGSVLLDSNCINVDLSPDDFFLDEHQIIFKAMLNLGRGIDQITVAQELSRMGKLAEARGASYLAGLVLETPVPDHYKYYAGIIKNHSLNRQLISAAVKIQNQAMNGDPQKSILEAEKLLTKIRQKQRTPSILNSQDIFNLADKHYGDLRTNKPGLLTGITNLDNKIGGILKGEYIVLIANTSVGKTTLGLQICRHIAVNHQALIFSLEMTPQALTDKNVASLSGVTTDLINLGNYPDSRVDKMYEALAKLAQLNITISTATTTGAMRNVIEHQLLGQGVDFVFIDYFHKIRDEHKDSEYQRLAYISRTLADMTKDYQIPFLVPAQLDRKVSARENKRPLLSDIRDCGKIEEDADAVWGLYRESYFDDLKGKETKSITTELNVLKNRLRGTTGKINLYWNQETESYK